jgi:hypothetical protein
MKFFKRKAPPTLAVVSDSTPQSTAAAIPKDVELETEVALLQTQLTTLEEEGRALTEQLQEIGSLAAGLKIRVSEGDVNAHASLDSLGRQELVISRRRDGLEARTAELRQELEPKMVRAATLAQEAAMERNRIRRQRELDEARETSMRLVQEVLEGWRVTCAKAYELAQILDGGMQSGDAEERANFCALNSKLMSVIFSASLEPTNEHWAEKRRDLFHNLQVRPARPSRPKCVAVEEAPSVEDRKVTGLAWSRPSEPHPATPLTLPVSRAV